MAIGLISYAVKCKTLKGLAVATTTFLSPEKYESHNEIFTKSRFGFFFVDSIDLVIPSLQLGRFPCTINFYT